MIIMNRKHKLVVIIAILALFFSGCLGSGKSEHYGVVISVNAAVTEETKEEVNTFIAEAVKQAAPDMNFETYVEWVVFDIETDTESYNRLMLGISETENYLYILADQPTTLFGVGEYPGISYTFNGNEWFDPLLGYSFEVDSEFKSRVKVNNTGLFERAGLGGIDLYANAIDWAAEGKGDEAAFQTAVKVIEAIYRS